MYEHEFIFADCLQVVYVTATLPYILIFAFLIRAVTLDGSYDGIKRYILPEWGQLITFRVCMIIIVRLTHTVCTQNKSLQR